MSSLGFAEHAVAQIVAATQTSITGPPLIPKGMRVSRWGARSDEEVDGWVPFQFNVPAAQNVTSVEFQLTVEPIGQLVSTDTFYCLDADGKGVGIIDDFERLKLKRKSVVTKSIDCQSHPGVMRQVRSGRLLCCLQDDTALFSAQMALDKATAAGGWKMPPLENFNSPAEVIGKALAITAPDPAEQDRRRAMYIVRAIHNRVQNDLQAYEPAEEVAARENSTGTPWDPWWIGAGYCRHHAALTIAMCRAAGVRNVKSISSSVTVPGQPPGHEFTVVNLPPGADLDRPWTWGRDALIVDSWNGEILTPRQAWKHRKYYAGGSAHGKVGDYGWPRDEQKQMMSSREAYAHFENNPDHKQRPSYARLVPADIRNNPKAPGALRPPTGWDDPCR